MTRVNFRVVFLIACFLLASAVGYPASKPKHTVILIHGLSQSSSDLASLKRKLQTALGSQFVVDNGFDFSECTKAGPFCSRNCTISTGAINLAYYLADYIKSHPDFGDFTLIGFSLGGLIARDLIVNRPLGILSPNRRVPVLVTLGTPNLGYPYDPVDMSTNCRSLVADMFGDFRQPDADALICPGCFDILENRSTGQRMALSKYLSYLNARWGDYGFPYGPDTWLAASGTSCAYPVRLSNLGKPGGLGCADQSPRNDGVVCDQSARLLWPLRRGPTDTSFASPSYVHGRIDGSWTIFMCNTTQPGQIPLSDPGPDLTQKITQALKNRLR